MDLSCPLMMKRKQASELHMVRRVKGMENGR